jgi:hypothetical protein
MRYNNELLLQLVLKTVMQAVANITSWQGAWNVDYPWLGIATPLVTRELFEAGTSVELERK